jgi:hypothetical protein
LNAKVLGVVKCTPEEPGKALPDGYNAAVMKVKRIFDEEVKQRQSERQHTLSLTLGQRYVMRELSVLFRASEDEDQKGQISGQYGTESKIKDADTQSRLSTAFIALTSRSRLLVLRPPPAPRCLRSQLLWPHD